MRPEAWRRRWLPQLLLLLLLTGAHGAKDPSKEAKRMAATVKAPEPAPEPGADRPRWASWETFHDGAEHEADVEPGTFRRYQHVMLLNRTLYVYLDPAATDVDDEALGSFLEPLTDYPIVENIKVPYQLKLEIVRGDPNAPDPLSACTDEQWVSDGPSMIYWTPWADNAFHYFTDAFGAVYPTLVELGYLEHFRDRDGWDLCDFQQRFLATNVTVLTWEKAENRKWSFPFRYMAKNMLHIKDKQPICFDTLILGRNMAMNWYVDYPAARRQKALKDLKWFLKHSAALNHLRAEQALGMGSIAKVNCKGRLPTVASQKPIAIFARRGQGYSRRAVINEPEIIRYVEGKFNVKVVSPDFKNMHAYHTLDLMEHATIFFGIHGAGWTQAMLLPPHSSAAVQIIPYGWHIAYDTLSRCLIYERMVEAAQAQYFQWTNPFAKYAFERHPQLGAGQNFIGRRLPRAHERVIHQAFVDQQTFVDLEHFGPVLDRALLAVGVLPRGGLLATAKRLQKEKTAPDAHMSAPQTFARQNETDDEDAANMDDQDE